MTQSEEEPVRGTIEINSEYANLVPDLSTQEYESLKQSIKEDGQYISIITNQDGTILDGHHRYKACQDLGIKPRTLSRDFTDPLLEKKFLIEVNRNRRHLTSFQRIELQYKLEAIENELARIRMSNAGRAGAHKRWNEKEEEDDNKHNDRVVQNYTTLRKIEGENTHLQDNKKEEEQQKRHIGRVIDVSAKKANVSPMTYFKGREIIKNAPEKVKERLRKDKVKIDKVYKQLQKQHKKQELISAEPILKLPEGSAITTKENVRLQQDGSLSSKASAKDNIGSCIKCQELEEALLKASPIISAVNLSKAEIRFVVPKEKYEEVKKAILSNSNDYCFLIFDRFSRLLLRVEPKKEVIE